MHSYQVSQSLSSQKKLIMKLFCVLLCVLVVKRKYSSGTNSDKSTVFCPTPLYHTFITHSVILCWEEGDMCHSDFSITVMNTQMKHDAHPGSTSPALTPLIQREKDTFWHVNRHIFPVHWRSLTKEKNCLGDRHEGNMECVNICRNKEV